MPQPGSRTCHFLESYRVRYFARLGIERFRSLGHAVADEIARLLQLECFYLRGRYGHGSQTPGLTECHHGLHYFERVFNIARQRPSLRANLLNGGVKEKVSFNTTYSAAFLSNFLCFSPGAVKLQSQRRIRTRQQNNAADKSLCVL